MTQRLLTIEEYKELINEAEDLSAKNTGNDYEIPTDVKVYPSCPSIVSEDETEKLATTKYECLGETLHDNIQSIIGRCNLPIDITMNEIHEAMAAEESLINFTNDMQDFILCNDWIENDEKSQMDVIMRQEWVSIANVYKHKRGECEEKLVNIISNTDTNEDLRKYAKNIYDQLTSNENKFDQLLRRIDAKLVKKDEDSEASTYKCGNPHQNSDLLKNLHIETRRSSTQSTADTDIVVNMFHTPTNQIKPATTLSNQNIGSGQRDRLGSALKDDIGQSPLLDGSRGRGKGVLNNQFDPFTQQNVGVKQPAATSVFPTTTLSNTSNLGTQYTNPGTTSPITTRPHLTLTKNTGQGAQSHASLLETLLLDNANVLLKHIQRENRLLQTQVQKMKGKPPNKHSEETFKDIERKVNKLRQDQDKIQNTYAKYISDHGKSTELNTI